MKKISCIIVFVIMGIACEENESDKLSFTKFKITDANGQSILKVDEKGTLTKNGVHVGFIKKSGIVEDKKERTVLQLAAGGSLFVDGEGKEVIEIDKNGTFLSSSGEVIHWNDAGELMRGEENTGISIYPVQKELLQFASVLLYIHYVI